MFSPEIVSFNKDDILNIMQIYRIHRIHLRINIWTGKIIINWNHCKSMQATIDTMFVNEKDYQNIFILSILTMKHKTNAF